MAAVIRILGQELRPLESIPTVGARLFDFPKATALRRAESDGWPVVGEKGSRLVIVPALADMLGLHYTVNVQGQPGDSEVSSE